MTFEWETYDRRSGRLAKAPELTVQSKGAMSLNSAAAELLGGPGAIELLYDKGKNVMGIRAVAETTAHAYPIRPVGKGGSFIISAKTFFDFYDLPLGTPIRRDVKMVGDVLIVDLNDPGRPAVSNRNRSKLKAEEGATDST